MRNDRSCLDCGQSPVVARDLCDPCYRTRKRKRQSLPPKLIFSFVEYLAGVVPDENDCWPWPGHVHKVSGYGHTGDHGRSTHAHVRSYEYHVGPVPVGYDVGHMCHDQDQTCLDWKKCLHRRCINPAHLKPQTRSENNRSKPKKTHCKRGHPLSGGNVYLIPTTGSRQCLTCRDLRAPRYKGRYPLASRPEAS